MSMVLRRLGKSVLLLERGSHPRFAIGESSTPFANLLLERIAEQYDLPFLRSLSEWGSWQRDFPELPAGLKRGLTFYHHTQGRPLDPADSAKQLLVAASPNDRVADTHWYRRDFDAFLVARAQELGVTFRDHAEIADATNGSDGWEITVRGKNPFVAKARFVVDATGPSGFPFCGTSIMPCPFMPETAGVFAHFRNVPRMDEIAPALRCRGWTRLGPGALAGSAAAPLHPFPYPPDDAAVHHVFPGGWIWVLRFNNGITSAGAALARNSEFDFNLEPRELWLSIIRRFPTLNAIFQSAEPVTPFYFSPRLAFRRTKVVGPNWAALPSAGGFVDPLLSTGFALNLLGILRLSRAFESCSADSSSHETETFRELEAAADLVSALYAKMDRFEEFALLSLLYFAALSYTETAWRLGKRELKSGFLLANDPRFSSSRADICARGRAGEPITREAIAKIIKPYDVAGLSDWNRFPFYPVDFADLTASAHKLNATATDLEYLLAKLGSQQSTATEEPRCETECA